MGKRRTAIKPLSNLLGVTAELSPFWYQERKVVKDCRYPLSELNLVSSAPIINDKQMPDAHPTDFARKIPLPNGGNLRLLEEARAALIAFGFQLLAFS